MKRARQRAPVIAHSEEQLSVAPAADPADVASAADPADREADQSTFKAAVDTCLDDKRISGYFARTPVKRDDIASALLDGDAFSQAIQRDSYIEYRDARKKIQDTIREFSQVLHSSAFNRRTATVFIGGLTLVVFLLIEVLKDNTPQIGILVAAGSSAGLSAFLFGRVIIERKRRLRRLLGSVGAIVISLFVIIVPHTVFKVALILPIFLAAWPIALITGYLLRREQTLGECFTLLKLGLERSDIETARRKMSQMMEEWIDDSLENVLLPLAVFAINAALGKDKDRLLVEQDSEGLRKLQDPSFTVSTLSEKRLAGALSQMDGGSIALAGPRGAGKSTLLKKFSGPLGTKIIESPCVSVYLAAPAEYVARDFIAELFQRLCEAYLIHLDLPLPRLIYRARPAFSFRRSVRRSFRIFWLFFRAAIALALVAWLLWPSVRTGYPHLHVSVLDTFRRWNGSVSKAFRTYWRQHKAPVRLLLIFLAVIFMPGPSRWKRHLRRRKDPPLARKAREYLHRLQIDKTVTWGTGLNSPSVGGAGFSVNRGGSASYTPWTLPELVGYTRRFMEEIAKLSVSSDYAVVVGIDEIDRIGSLDHAERFISEIKAVFGIEKCFFLVAVAEDVGSIFAQRATAGRSILENAFDDIVVVEPLSFEETRDLLLKRVPGFTDSFAYLAYALSGGLPRELIRVARRLVDVNQELGSNGRSPQLEDLAFVLVRDELLEAIRATRNQLSLLTLHDNWAGYFQTMYSASASLRRISLLATYGVRGVIEELGNLSAPDPLGGSAAEREIVIKDEENAKRIVSDFSAFSYFGSTVIDAFRNDVFDLQAVQQGIARGAEISYEGLAVARNELSVSSASSRALLFRFRGSLPT